MSSEIKEYVIKLIDPKKIQELIEEANQVEKMNQISDDPFANSDTKEAFIPGLINRLNNTPADIDSVVKSLADDKKLKMIIEATTKMKQNEISIENDGSIKAILDELKSLKLIEYDEIIKNRENKNEKATQKQSKEEPKAEINEEDEIKQENNEDITKDEIKKEEATEEANEDIEKEEKTPLEELTENADKPISIELREKLLNQVANMGMPENIEAPIRKAYESAIYLSDLTDPEYLRKYLEKDDNVKKMGLATDTFGKFHKSILMNTYVDCKIDDNAEKLQETPDEEMNVSYLEFPQTIDEMPQWMKNQVSEDVVYYMKRVIDRVVNSNNSYDALVLITPIDRMYDESLEYTKHHFEQEQGGNAELRKAYVKYLASDSKFNLKDQFRTGVQNIDVRINAADVDWTNPRVRKEMITLLNRSGKEAYNQNIEQLVKNVSFDIMVYSKEDVDKLKDTVNDLKGLNVTKDVTVVVATEDPEERREISEAVDKTISNDSDIQRNTIEEEKIAVQNMISDAILIGATAAVTMGVANVALGLENNSNEEQEQNNQEPRPISPLAREYAMDAMNNQRLVEEIASRGENPIEYMEQLIQDQLDYEEDYAFEHQQDRYDDNNNS